MTLDEFKNKHYGPKGTKRRDELEEGYENFKLGALLLEARLKKGMTQEQLAQKAGTTKSLKQGCSIASFPFNLYIGTMCKSGLNTPGNIQKQLMIKNEDILYIHDRLCKENLDYLT